MGAKLSVDIQDQLLQLVGRDFHCLVIFRVKGVDHLANVERGETAESLACHIDHVEFVRILIGELIRSVQQ